jgi:anaerobic selenocysteine-containing dehydrogenase
MARATLPHSPTDWDALVGDYDRIRDHIEHVVPGFKDYNRRVRQHGGFELPNPIREQTYATASGKAEFTVQPMTTHQLKPGELMMMTIRSHDQYNTTIYGLDDRYRGVHHGRRVILLNEADCAELGIAKGDLVDIKSCYEGQTRTAPSFRVYPYPIPRRCAATYFPEANVLVPINHVAEKSNTPVSKSIVITLTRRVQD